MPEVGFDQLAARHLADLHAWLSAPQVARWWGPPPPAAELEAKYLPAGPPENLTRFYVALLDGRPIGLVQTYRWGDHPEEARGIGASPNTAGLDYLIGDPELIGRGIGPLVLGRFLERFVWSDPRTIGVMTSVPVENRRSWRCLEKLGFTRGSAREVPGESGPQYVMSIVRPGTTG